MLLRIRETAMASSSSSISGDLSSALSSGIDHSSITTAASTASAPQFIYQQQQYCRRSIHEININKNANFLEYTPTNIKNKTSPSNNIVKINNKKWTEPPIHPVTDTNSDQSRPRHLTTPEMIKRLDPISLDQTIGLHEYNDGRIFESSADVVKVTFKSSRRTNYALYASDRSDNNLLKKLCQLWNTYKEKIWRLLNTMPLEAKP